MGSLEPLDRKITVVYQHLTWLLKELIPIGELEEDHHNNWYRYKILKILNKNIQKT